MAPAWTSFSQSGKAQKEENKAKSTGHPCRGWVGAHLHSRAEAGWWKGVESQLTGLSGAFVVKSGKAVKLHLPLSALVRAVQKLLGTKLAWPVPHCHGLLQVWLGWTPLATLSVFLLTWLGSLHSRAARSVLFVWIPLLLQHSPLYWLSWCLKL